MIAYAVRMKDEKQELALEEAEVAQVRWVSREEYGNLTFFPEYKTTLDRYFEDK